MDVAFGIVIRRPAAKSPADGYTVAVALVSTTALLPVMVNDLRFDPLKDLPPVIGLAEGRFVFGSPSGTPWKTFNEFVAYAKDNPGKLNYGSAVPVVRVLIEAITRAHGLNVIYIPYTAYAPLQQALLAGEIQMSFVAQVNVDAMGEKFRVLAVTGDSRLLSFPNVPMFKELGFDKIRGISYSLNVRAGTPKAAIDKLHAATSRALQEPEVRAQLTKLRLEVINEGPEAATRALNEAAKFYGDVALQIGLKPQ